MVKAPAWPLFAEILLDELCALLVHRSDESDRFRPIGSTLREPPDFLFRRRIEEDVKRILTILQKERGAAADENAVAFIGGGVDDTLREAEDRVGVQQLQAVNIEASFEAASQERFQQPIVERIHALFPFCDLRVITLQIGRASC